MHFKGLNKTFSKWLSGHPSTIFILIPTLILRECPPPQRMVVVTWHRALVDKQKQAHQEEEKAVSDAAEEEAGEKDKVEEATVEVAKAMSAGEGNMQRRTTVQVKPRYPRCQLKTTTNNQR